MRDALFRQKWARDPWSRSEVEGFTVMLQCVKKEKTVRNTVLQSIPAPLISSITLKPAAITKFGKRLKTSGEAASRKNCLIEG